ncbi:hypothetical protein CRENBAI_005992 [Crenichthys baileyi]|uniref:Secreted protein n=1 Tax=Crenichthys baileyi TaxID=28760 RepID=A0AAV9SJK3_9TELE
MTHSSPSVATHPISLFSLLHFSLPLCLVMRCGSLNGLTLCLGTAGRGKEGERCQKSEREVERQASGSKGECTWMGRLPGHAVRGFCPACQQPLSFNGTRISSF